MPRFSAISVGERAVRSSHDAWEWIRSRRNPCRETFDRPCLHGSGRAVRDRAARSGARDRGSRRRAGSRAAVRAGRPPGGAAARVWAGRTVRADGRERSLRRADRRAPRPLESGRPREDRSERQGSRRPLPVPPRFPGQRASARLRLRALGAPDHGRDAADRVRARRLRSREPGQARSSVLVLLRLQRLQQSPRGRLGDDPAQLRRKRCARGALRAAGRSRLQLPRRGRARRRGETRGSRSTARTPSSTRQRARTRTSTRRTSTLEARPRRASAATTRKARTPSSARWSRRSRAIPPPPRRPSPGSPSRGAGESSRRRSSTGRPGRT